jgi:tetratricopeptide (TPR) repeat protein
MRVLLFILQTVFLLSCQSTWAQTGPVPMTADCGNPFVNGYGPYDYRKASDAQKSIVESYRFTATVETLRGGASGPIGGDLDYTLRAFPNHPRALTALVRLSLRDKTLQPQGAHWPVDCYFVRAIAFVPDDMTPRQIRGTYYARLKRYDAAIRDLEQVVARHPDNGPARYNLGLCYFEMKEYDKALTEAKAAAALGFKLEGLRAKLKSVGKWVN